MTMLDLIRPSELSRVAALQVLARQVVEGFCSGKHRSPHKGFSVEFKEHRQYMRGDELRNVDWKVFGKSDKLFIREYEEETNLRCNLLVDISGSMGYAGDRSEGVTKYDYATRLAACLTYLMLGQQDSVGLTTFDNTVRRTLPPRGRASQLKSILQVLAKQHSASGDDSATDLRKSFRLAASSLKRRGMVLILSDAMCELEPLSLALAQFRASQHEIVFFQIVDPDELDFPFDGRIQFRDMEHASNQQTVEASSLRSFYLEQLRQHQDTLQTICRKHRVDLVTLTTDRPLVDGLHEYVSRRRRMR